MAHIDRFANAKYDYVINGGGTAGCVLAGRLSADANSSVLLIDAGGSSVRFQVRMPAGVSSMLENSKWDWCYETDSDPSIGGRRFTWCGGKCLE